jgi:hypothetical protein
VNVTAENLGNYTESLDVTVYANLTDVAVWNNQTKTLTFNATTVLNETEIGNFTNVSISAGNSVNLTAVWNSSGLAKGNYTISANVTLAPGETNTASNNFTGSFFYVSMVGDLTGGTPNIWDFVPDGKCDGKDIAVAAYCFGSGLGSPRYNPNCDILNRGKIDGRDITIVAKHFGQHDP